MIYKNDVLIQWDGKKDSDYTPDEQEVRDQILGKKGVKQKYFGEQTSKRVKLLYPNGEPKEFDGGYSMLKMFPIPLNSADGQWRFTASKVTKKGYTDSHKFIKHDTLLKERDLEFVWFLCTHSAVFNKYVFIEDLEADAKLEVEEMASDADIRYMLMSPRSPIAQNEAMLREIAEIFNLPNVHTKKVNEIKVELYDTIKEGNDMNDVFCNFEKFDELTQGETAREAAYVARRAISDNIVGYSAKDRAWFIMAGRDYSEKIVSITAGEANFREELFINAVTNNKNVRERLFSAMGVEMQYTVDKLRDLDIHTLKAKYKQLTGEHKNIKKEELVGLLCEKLKIEYAPLA